jgi:hypothetical protein
MALNWFIPEKVLTEHFDDFFNRRVQQYSARDTLQAACWVILAGTPRKTTATCRDLCQLRYGDCSETATTHCNITNAPDASKEPTLRTVWARMTPYLEAYRPMIVDIVGAKRFRYFFHWLATEIENQDTRKPKKERPKEPFKVPAPELITIADFESDPWTQFMNEKRRKEACLPSSALQPSL